MKTVTKSITSLFHVFGTQAKHALITGVNEKEEYFVCDMLDGMFRVMDAGRHLPFAKAPFELTGDERRILKMTPLGAVVPESKVSTPASPEKVANPLDIPKGEPSMKWTVIQLQAILSAKGIKYSDNDNKAVMLGLLGVEVKPKAKKKRGK